jgi:hypothetical protein
MHRLLFFLPLLLAGCPAAGGTTVVVNEFLASNVDGLVDSSGGTPDWIELFNLGPEDVSLNGWTISDNSATPDRQGLDGLTVPGDGFLLLFASGDPSLGEGHLAFRLSAAGEQVLLTDLEGGTDQIVFGAQTTDVSLARVPDGVGEWQEATPSPGASNE